MRIPIIVVLMAFATSLHAQNDFQYLDADGAGDGPMRLGLYGFSARMGISLEGQEQAVASFAVDMGDLYTDRLRLRPSAELGFGWGENTYVANVEAIYRFTADSMAAVPYVGGGIALAGQEGCGQTDGCPAVWGQFVLGFELRLRNRINWLLEYHAEDAFQHHRLFLGLTTRRGT